jgi:hypothetical protein
VLSNQLLRSRGATLPFQELAFEVFDYFALVAQGIQQPGKDPKGLILFTRLLGVQSTGGGLTPVLWTSLGIYSKPNLKIGE